MHTQTDCSNNQAEYVALIIGLEILLDMRVTTVQISGDSQLVIKQLNGEFKCNAPGLEMYFSIASYLLTKFDDVTIIHVPRIDNGSANVMAQLASGLKVHDGINEQWVKVSKQLTLIGDRYGQLEMVNPVDTIQDGWRTPIIQYLQNPQLRVDAKMKLQAIKYFLLDGDLFKRTPEGLTLRCLGQQEAMHVMAEVHEGVCGAHQAGRSFRVAMQSSVLVTEYNEAMAIELEDLDDHRLDALDKLHAQKLKKSHLTLHRHRVLLKKIERQALFLSCLVLIEKFLQKEIDSFFGNQ
ncbi:hypothetical protein RJ640_006386 [Escallonia rubra]|uniref:RNase H type-1 domain-containing protein n=1 Tax=Escallonia rubra TaxID=112253 RepID=A0AA88S4G7_9ASTE|nr:hypothetical protein RJ640_006386 [Escallonia rubra]